MWAGQHVSSVQCCYSRQQRSPSQPAMRSACEVSACSVLTDINVPRGCAPIQPSTARLSRQIRCVCASPAWLEAQQDPASTAQVGAAWWPLWLDSWRVIELPVTLKASARNGTTPTLPHMRHSVGNRRTRPDRQNAEIGSETWKNRRGNLVGIRIEVRLAQKTFKSRWETWEDSELYANGNEFGKSSK